MSYGTRGRRKSLDPDPTVIPSTSALGFLGRLPFKLGGTLRYKPSAADLQENPGGVRAEVLYDEEGEPLMADDHSGDERHESKGHRRQRSSTTSSGETSDSFRSRGDLFPSDGEDDAVPLSDEFATVLERRSMHDDRSSGKTRSSRGKRPAGSRTVSSRNPSRTTQSSQSRPSFSGMRSNSGGSLAHPADLSGPDMIETPSLTDLQYEEERIRMEEEDEIERKREAAARLARERGLHDEEPADETILESKPEASAVEDIFPGNDSEHAEASEELVEPPAVSPPAKEFIPARLPNFG